MKKQIILTGVSGSGKTTLMLKLLQQFKETTAQPLQFTTRAPRDDAELDTYVFLTREQFYRKLDNGDFAEWTEYNGNLYAVSKFFDTEISNVFIVEPAGKSQLIKHFLTEGIPYSSFFLNIPIDVAKERMMNRGDSVKNIEKRLSDFKYFLEDMNDVPLDGELTIQHNVERVGLLCKLGVS